jgi:hypothetical protein
LRSVFLAQLIAPGQGSLLYKYKTEVKLSVANGQYDLKTEITADVNIKALGNCDYALQVRDSIDEFNIFIFIIASKC